MTVRRTIDIQRASRVAGIPTDRQFRKWLNATLDVPVEIGLRIVNMVEAHKLNNAYRRKDYATNVLTFVYHEPGATTLQGDIVLCAQVVAREAREQQKSLMAHYAHLTVHGALHLAGWDHEKKRDAGAMEAREIDVLEKLGYTNPYS